MIRHNEPGIRVTLSDEGLRRAYGDNEILNRLKRVELLHGVLAWASAIGLGLLLAYSACNGN